MTELPRDQRIAEYRAASREADQCADRGRTEDALAILRPQRDRAQEAGDEDYRLFFEAELLNYEAPDQPRQIALLAEAFAWQRHNGIPEDHFLLRSMGIYHSLCNQEDAAIEWYDKALAVNPKDSGAMRERGVSLGEKGDLDASIEWFDKALAVNPNDSNAMRERGVSLSYKGDEDAAIEWYDKSLAVNPNDSDAMRNRGVSLSKKGDLDAAIGWYGKALAINPEDAAAHREWAVTAYNAGKPDDAYRHIVEVVRLDPKKYGEDFRFVCRATERDPDAEWRAIFPEAPTASNGHATPVPVPASAANPLDELLGFIGAIRTGYGEEANEFLRQIEENKKQEADFLGPKSNLDASRSLVLVLRKWNSYTPAIPTAEDERSRGGGYFVWHGGKGTVIDPGFNFLENFHEAGCRIRDIDSVILTHAHVDHTTDFEPLRTLLHQFNDAARKAKDGQEKKVDFYLSNGAFLKFGGWLNLQDWDFTHHVATLNPGGQFELAGGIELRVLQAYHDDLVTRDQAVGLFLTVPVADGGKRTILFTGDTGLFPLEKDGKELRPNTNGSQIWESYGLAKGESPDLMVIHIGSVKDSEFKMDIGKGPREICYPNHLGIIGTARLITQCRPRLAVVSEFGEELRQFRCPLVEGLQEKVVVPFLKTREDGVVPRVVPGDLPFIYDIKRDGVYCVLTEEWVNVAEIAFALEKKEGGLENSVFYFKQTERNDLYTRKWDAKVTDFKTHRKYQQEIYFARQN